MRFGERFLLDLKFILSAQKSLYFALKVEIQAFFYWHQLLDVQMPALRSDGLSIDRPHNHIDATQNRD